MDVYYIDGEFLPENKAFIPVNDLSILRGLGVFDFMRTYNRRPFLLQAHITRLQKSARQIGLDFPWTVDELSQIVMETLHLNSHEESCIRILITGGSSPDFITPMGNPRLIVLVTERQALPSWWYTEGVKLISIPLKRDFPGAKSINYIPATIALKKAALEHAKEAIYVDRNNRVLEGTSSNLFAFKENRLLTPGRDILSGITRSIILEIASTRYDIEVRNIKLAELIASDEVFISGTNKGIVPVVQINNTHIGSGTPGNHTAEMAALFEKYTTGSTTGHSLVI